MTALLAAAERILAAAAQQNGVCQEAKCDAPARLVIVPRWHDLRWHPALAASRHDYSDVTVLKGA